MIPILYDKTGVNRIGLLSDCIKCEVLEERNGEFELTLIYPSNSELLEGLDKENIIISDANDFLKNQKFRIYNTRKLMSNRIEVRARHISFDLAHDWIDTISIDNQPCEYVLNTIFRNSQHSTHYRGYSDIVMSANYTMNKANCIEAIGGKTGSILDTFGNGAEILRDNTDIYILNNRGHDNEVSIEYRKNLTGLTVEEDTTDLVTRIRPYAIVTDNDGNEVETMGNFIDSPLINNYAHPYVKYIDYSSEFDDENTPTVAKLHSLAVKEYEVNKIDIPKLNYKIEFVPLSKCAGYEGLEDRINLCDTVTIRDTRYNIDTQAKVIKVVYNVLRNRYDKMELGEPRTTLGDVIGGSNSAVQGPPGPPGPQGPAGADGSIGDFPNTLPPTPVITTKLYGFASIELTWTFENKVYYLYELYASKVKGFVPNTFNLLFSGQASTFLHQVKPTETWYYRVCAINSHGQRTEFSPECEVKTIKINDLSDYVESASIGDALIGTLSLDRGWVGQLHGNWIDAKQLSVTDGNGKRTLDIDSYGNVNLDVNELKINSKDVLNQEQTKTLIEAKAGEISLSVAKIENSMAIDNLLANGNFTNELNNWHYRDQGSSVNYTLTANTDWTMVGKTALLLTQSQHPQGYDSGFTQEIEVKPNTNYTFTGYIASHRAEGMAIVKDEAGNWLVFDKTDADYDQYTGGADISKWKRVRLVYYSGNRNKLQLHLALAKSNENGHVWFHDFMVTEGDTDLCWKPSERETRTRIDQLSDRITSTVSSIQTVDGKVNQAQSQIDQQAHQIASKVNSGDFSSLIQQNSSSIYTAISNGRGVHGVGIDTSGLYLFNNNLVTARLTEGKFHAYNSWNGKHMGYFGTNGDDLRACLYDTNTFSVYSNDTALLFRARYERDANYGNATLDMCGGINFIHKPGQDVGVNQILLGNDDRSDAYGYHNMSIRCWNSLGFQDNHGLTNMFFDVRRGRIIMKGGLYQNTQTPPSAYVLSNDPRNPFYSGVTSEQMVRSILKLETTVKVDTDDDVTMMILPNDDDLAMTMIDNQQHVDIASIVAGLVETVKSLNNRILELESELNK